MVNRLSVNGETPSPELESTDKEAQHELKRRAILRAAGRLFNERGFYRTSLNDVARELKVTKPTLYYYIKNKDDILYQCLQTALADMEGALAGIRKSAQSSVEKIRQFTRTYVNLYKDDMGRCTAQPGPEPLSQEYREKINSLYARIDKLLREIISEGIADGKIASYSPNMASFTLFGALSWSVKWRGEDDESSLDQLAEQMANIFIHGLMGVPRDKLV